MSGRDAWSNPSRVGREDATRMAAFLEDRARCPDQRQVNDCLMAVLDPQHGERNLEAGSGSGVLARMAASRPDLGCSVVGADVSPDMIREANTYLDGSAPGNVSYMVAAAESFPFHDGAFDAAFAARLLLHVADPDAVLRRHGLGFRDPCDRSSRPGDDPAHHRLAHREP
jgi:ubiquinone/menaquinone biosynthesis C-methylase UbiE